MSIKRSNLRTARVDERGAKFRELNAQGVRSDDPRRLRAASEVFPAAGVEAQAWLEDDDIVIRLLADLIRRLATDGRSTRRGGGRGDPTRDEVAAVFEELVSKYRVAGSGSQRETEQ